MRRTDSWHSYTRNPESGRNLSAAWIWAFSSMTRKMSLESVMLQSVLLSVFLFLVISVLLKLERVFHPHDGEKSCAPNPGVWWQFIISKRSSLWWWCQCVATSVPTARFCLETFICARNLCVQRRRSETEATVLERWWKTNYIFANPVKEN